MEPPFDHPRKLLKQSLRAETNLTDVEIEHIAERLGEEEALYWYSKCSGAESRRGLAALIQLCGDTAVETDH